MYKFHSLGLLAFGAVSALASQPPEPLSTEMFSCWISGSGDNYMKACVSKHGNLTSFQSPAGREHIRVGKVIEGYTLCWNENNPSGALHEYIDLGDEEDGWQEPYNIHQPNGKNTLPLTIYRKSTDGLLELEQKFARDSAELDLTITMTIYNRSNRTMLGARLFRTADFDVSGTPGDDFFLAAGRSVVAGPAVSMMVFGADNAVFATYKNWSDEWGSYCEPSVGIMWQHVTAEPGDYVGVVRQMYGVNLKPGARQTLKVVYRIH